MDDAGFVRVLQARAKLLAERDDFLPRDPAAAEQQVIERFAFDVLHRVERRVLQAAAGVQADDVGMLELLEDVGLALETGLGVRAGAQSGGHDLDGHARPLLHVPRAIHRPHRAAAQLLLDGERADLLSDEHDCPRPASRSLRNLLGSYQLRWLDPIVEHRRYSDERVGSSLGSFACNTARENTKRRSHKLVCASFLRTRIPDFDRYICTG